MEPCPLPPFYHVLEGKSQGVAIALVSGAGTYENKGYAEMKGASIGGLASIISGDFKGFQFGTFDAQAENSDGVNISGVAAVVERELKGLSIGGVASYVGSNCHGVSIGGLSSYVKSELTGASISPGVNMANSNGKFAFQMGLVNSIREYNNGLVIQIGLYNRAGNRTIPLINIRGLRNLFKRKPKPKDVLIANLDSTKRKRI